MIDVIIKNCSLKLNTNNKVFSPKSIDKGTLAMLSKVDFKEKDKVLDLGCGYGVVGIVAAKHVGEDNVVMCDISDDALNLTHQNTESNGVPNIRVIKSFGLNNIDDCNFNLILSNPPYHTNFNVAKNFIEKGYTKLIEGGHMVMVTKRKDWYKNKLISVFGGVKISQIDGYYVFVAEKKDRVSKKIKSNKQGMSKKLKRKMNRMNGNNRSK